ncbi:hypothetical protein H1S01_09640 [Heliobacterium chlorum]|uniref:Outer membrane lipoprotein-sorting protein n=1 Tax=Heliobacterium chlorum TaxID=2698 RepID=A0ABR7T1V9_HELCL|nr:hypothetical protein [Heliobacterium chlorum]MBC9784772.1 hypothetical protein [Heliobacterium chlorum]
MRRRWIYGMAVVILLTIVGAAYIMRSDHQERWNPRDPLALVKKAMAGTLQSPQFRFESTFLIRVNGREEVVSRFSGERAEVEKFYLKGTLLQSPTEIYTVGDLFYLWDPIKKSWYNIEKNKFGPQDLLLSEISPLNSLEFKNIEGVTVVGRDTIRDKKCLVLECRVEVSNRLLAAFWKDFYYRLWIDPVKQVLYKSTIEATSRNAPQDRLLLTIEFWDYDKQIQVEPPTVSTKQ